MIAALCILHTLQMGFQIFLLIIGSSVDTLESGFVGVPSPISHGGRCQLKSFYSLGAHQMRPCAQIHKLALPVEGNLCILRQILNQFYFIRLLALLHKSNGLGSGQGKPLQLLPLLDDFLHLCFQRIQILPGKSLMVKIIIKSRVNTGPDGQFRIRKQILHRLRQYMGSRMADRRQSFLVIGRTDCQLTVMIDNGT